MRRLLAFVVVLAAACGDDGGVNQLADAPVFDAPDVDAQTSGVVTLTITSGTAGVADVKVYFQNADSSVVAVGMTDANGVVFATMEAGGYVTAIDPFAAVSVPTGIARTSDLRTFGGVKPGDQLKLNVRGQDPTVNFTLTLPTEPNALFYQLHTPCQILDVTDTDGSGGLPGPGGPISLTGCGTTTDFVIVAHDPDGFPITSIHKPNVVLVEGGTIDLTAETFVATQDVTFSYESVPSNIGSLNVASFLASPRGSIAEAFSSALATNNMAMTTPVKRPVVAGSLQITATTFFGGNFGRPQVIEWGPPTTAYTLSMGNLLTPTILVPDYTSVPGFDATTHAITWTTDAIGKLPDFTVANVFFDRTVGLAQTWIWEIVAPHTTTSIAFPVLPAPDDRFNALGTDNTNVNELTTAKVPGGYDAIRANVLALEGPTGLVTGAAGQVVFQELQLGKLRKRQPASRVLRPWVRSARPASSSHR